MPNVGDIIRAADFSGAGIKAGAVVPFYHVTLSGRYPIFWGESEADTGWLVCDGGSDLNGGNVPNLINRFIMGTNTVANAKKTGGSTTTSSTSTSGSIGATTLSTTTSPNHRHNLATTNNAAGINNTTGYAVTYGNGGTIQTNTTVISLTSGSSGSHTHSFTGSSHTHTLTPPYYSLIYLVKLP